MKNKFRLVAERGLLLAKVLAPIRLRFVHVPNHQPAIIFLCLIFLFFPLLVLAGGEAGDYKISSHFWASEFRCRCGCGKLVVDQRLLQKLEILRNALGNRAITITSGYRCPAHNKAVGGVKDSYHMFGMAADIQVKDKTPHEVAIMARSVGLWAIEYETFCHVDVR